MTTTAIIGCAGYSGQETLDRVLSHPELEPIALGSDSLAGLPASALDPRLAAADLPPFVTNDHALASGAELIFLCLGHEQAAAVDPPADAVIIDLSGAHRLHDPSLYTDWYGWAHPLPTALSRLELCVAGAFPARGEADRESGLLCDRGAARAAAARRDAIDPSGVVVDAKSGVSGAGRALKASSHAGSVLENVAPYRVGTHQHAPEIAQGLGFPVCFVPHLLPVRRGLLATCYVHAVEPDLRGRLEAAYAATPAVLLLPEGVSPELARVAGTDAAEVALFQDKATDTAIVICALDNLGKGAAGQAVQNANLALGLDETMGLRLQGVMV